VAPKYLNSCCIYSLYMDILGLKKGYRRAKKTKMISIRVEPEDYKWIQKNDLSPTRIFDNAMLNLRRKKRMR
jgi:hypothetical protein